MIGYIPEERRVSLLQIVVILVAVGLIGLGVFHLVNSESITATRTVVTVVEVKEVVPAYTTTIFMKSGNAMIPITTHHPESYHLYFKIDGNQFERSVNKKFFEGLRAGDKIEVDYGLGRLNGSCVPVEIRLAHNE